MVEAHLQHYIIRQGHLFYLEH